jgi:hypothetical protein
MSEVAANDLQNALFRRAYHQALCEYEQWDVYVKEQWKCFTIYGQEDMLDLALALLSGARRVSYPLPALDLAAYTLAKFGLDRALAAIPPSGLVYNERTGDNDPSQVFTLNIRAGARFAHRLHLAPHLLARCAILMGGESMDYFATLQAAGARNHDVIICTERELRRVRECLCPYEEQAESLCDVKGSDPVRRAASFFREGAWCSPELEQQIKGEAELERMMFDVLRGRTDADDDED